MASDRPQTRASAPRFFLLRVRAAGIAPAERLSAEAWAAGAAGVEERDVPGGVELIIYAPSGAIGAVRAAVKASGDASAVSRAEAVAEADWSEQWKRGLQAIDVSPRLRVRPSFVAAAARPGQHELVIDPGQAFGTGGHESTRLALAWIDQIAGALATGSTALDVGTGTGVLALAAIRLAGVRAVAFDLDPLAAPAARANAERNGLRSGLEVFTGSLAAIGDRRFDLLLVNLLKNEMLPLVPDLAARVSEGGGAVFSGILHHESSAVRAALEAAGFAFGGVRSARDANGDLWESLLMRR